jgi:hypothetical protein
MSGNLAIGSGALDGKELFTDRDVASRRRQPRSRAQPCLDAWTSHYAAPVETSCDV